ncbi:MAG TPA: autotransporter-associated beta strand repeat-containing protein, partial [Verrucomicrobiae bacterium]
LLSRGAAVSLTAADPGGTTSFNATGKWNNSQAPSAANDYFTAAYFLRTPVDSGGVSYTFAGNSLTLQQPTSSGVRSLIVKSGNNDTFTINNLTNAFGGILENGGSGNVVENFTGNQWTIAGNSAVMGNQGSLVIGYPLVGATGVILTNGGGNAAGITYNGNNSGFQGIFYVSTVNFGNGGGNSKLVFGSGNSMPGNPATFTPNQIWIGAGCTVQDSAGLTFNNANGGFLLNGPGTATLQIMSSTTIAEPITDNTNGVSSGCSLTLTGGGNLTLSGVNTYSGGTIISAGTLKVGSALALTNSSTITDNGVLDLNGFNTTVSTLTGSGSVDNTGAGTATLTVGTGGASSSFAGYLQNSGGALNLVKVGAGALTLAGGYTYSGVTVAAGGTLNLVTTANLPSSPGNLVVSNGATVAVNAAGGTALPVAGLVVGTNSSLSLTPTATSAGVSGTGNLTLQDNAVIAVAYPGALTANPSAAAINVAGAVQLAGTNLTINLAATGLKSGN